MTLGRYDLRVMARYVGLVSLVTRDVVAACAAMGKEPGTPYIAL